MTTTTTTATNVAAVESIGRRVTRLEKDTTGLAERIIATRPAGFDWTARGAITTAIHEWATGSADKANWPVQRKADKTPTPYGVGVDTLAHAVRRIVKGDDDSAPVMRVSLKGTGSGVVPVDHPAYPLLLALLTADSEA